jgi:cytochrome c2
MAAIVMGAGMVSSTQASELDPLEVMRAKGCTACHIIPGIPEAKGTMGPTLKDIGNRKRIVARTLSNNEKNMRRWLKNPKKVRSGTMMPNVGLSDAEIDALVAHFFSE